MRGGTLSLVSRLKLKMSDYEDPQAKLIDGSYLAPIHVIINKAGVLDQKISGHPKANDGICKYLIPRLPVSTVRRRLLDLTPEEWPHSVLDYEDCRLVTNIPMEILIYSVASEVVHQGLTMVDLIYRQFLDLVALDLDVAAKPSLSKRVLGLLASVAPSSRSRSGVPKIFKTLESETDPNRARILGRLSKIELLRKQFHPMEFPIFGRHDRQVAQEVRSHLARRIGSEKPCIPTDGLAEELKIHKSILAVVWYSVMSGRYTENEQARHCAWAKATRRLLTEIVDRELLEAGTQLGED